MSKGSELEAVRTGPSRHGFGVFAIRECKAGEVVGELTGQVIQDPDYESDYCIEIDSEISLEPDEPFRFINHSCNPNCQLACSADNPMEIWVEAIRDIEPEEEITIDYAWPAESAIVCGCGSPNCRGWIVSSDQLGEIANYHGDSCIGG